MTFSAYTPKGAPQEGTVHLPSEAPDSHSVQDEHLRLVQQALDYLETHFDEAPTLADLSVHVSVSPFHLQRMFKRLVGISPRQYVEARRLKCLKGSLRAGSTVTDALYSAGYGSSSRLYEHTDAKLGMTPGEYSRGGEGMCIHYMIVDCPLGWLLVAITERGICAVHLGGGEEELIRCLYNEYPAAQIERSTPEMCDWVSSILAHLEGRLPHLHLPLDIRATAFQWRVWDQLRRIPYGETRTYGEIAVAIGQPHAASAVARACYSNRAALVIPCHRAVREDGNASSFYASERAVQDKQMLLDYEHQQCCKQQPGTQTPPDASSA